jgi:xylan 1,4-beta-xylosidase
VRDDVARLKILPAPAMANATQQLSNGRVRTPAGRARRRACAALLSLSVLIAAAPGRAADTVIVDAAAPSHPFPHFWETMFGSGRAALSLRDSYRRDLRAVRAVTAAGYVRFHGIFHDELGVYDEDALGRPVYNFSYIDQIYDGLRADGIRPFVELGFMPAKLAAKPMRHPFWYRPLISPPKDYRRWDALIGAFARHLIERYGADEVRQWYFEVWNEPNLDFWGGKPKQQTYFELYDHTVRALKAVDERLRVGGPATAQAAWIPAFLGHAAAAHVPVDFVSTHVYANDTSENVFHTHAPVARDRMVCRAVAKVHDEIRQSAFPTAPLIWSEFNASYMNEPAVTDSAYMGPWLATTISQCDGLVDAMSYWTFSDVFEEQGVVKRPFYGGFGLVAAGGTPKAAFNDFALLHRLGEVRLEVVGDQALLTRAADGTLALALWNYAPPGARGAPRPVEVRLRNRSAATASITTVDPDHGNALSAYLRMGGPRYPTEAQLVELRGAAALPEAVERQFVDGSLALEIPAHGLALLTIR